MATLPRANRAAALQHTAQAVLAVLFVACLIPAMPLDALARGVALLVALAALGYATFGLANR
jgi:hypothetical protein